MCKNNAQISSIPREMIQKNGVNLKKLKKIVWTFKLAYLPCLFALRDQWARSSCYKIMFYVAILDVIVLWITGFATGVFVVMGTVYCSMPTLMYVLGTIASGK